MKGHEWWIEPANDPEELQVALARCEAAGYEVFSIVHGDATFWVIGQREKTQPRKPGDLGFNI